MEKGGVGSTQLSDDRGRVNPVSGDHQQESLLLIHAAAEHQGISQPHYEMRVCRSSHTSAALA